MYGKSRQPTRELPACLLRKDLLRCPLCRQHPQNILFRDKAQAAVDHPAVPEQQQGWNGTDAELGGKFHLFVHIDLADSDLALKFLRELMDDGRSQRDKVSLSSRNRSKSLRYSRS